MTMTSPHKPSSAWHALSPTGRTMLGELLQHSPLLAFDFDGTLAPIVSDPAAAALPDGTAERLRQLASRVSCVIVSGRARSDVLTRMQGIPLAEAVGNHGSEPWVDPAPLRAEVASWLPLLGARLGHLPGVFIEDKGSSLSIHYRHVALRQEVVAIALVAARELGIHRIIHGKCVLNLLPSLALQKGAGLCRAMEALKNARALYIGDDDTDEDVFRLPARAGVLGIRVGHQAGSQAPLYLYGQLEMDQLLDHLLARLP